MVECLSSLPVELHLRVLGFLDPYSLGVVRRTSQYFYRLGHDELLIKRFPHNTKRSGEIVLRDQLVYNMAKGDRNDVSWLYTYLYLVGSGSFGGGGGAPPRDPSPLLTLSHNLLNH